MLGVKERARIERALDEVIGEHKDTVLAMKLAGQTGIASGAILNHLRQMIRLKRSMIQQSRIVQVPKGLRKLEGRARVHYYVVYGTYSEKNWTSSR